MDTEYHKMQSKYIISLPKSQFAKILCKIINGKSIKGHKYTWRAASHQDKVVDTDGSPADWFWKSQAEILNT